MAFYVTAIDGSTVYWMAGPYEIHQAALDAVKPAMEIANKHDGRAWFMAWGTAKTERNDPGTLTRLQLL